MSLAVMILAAAAGGCSRFEPASNAPAPALEKNVDKLKRQRDAVTRFFSPMRVQKGDWLSTRREAGETFEEYIAAKPTLPTAERRTIYIQPIGTFTDGQRRVLRSVADYMRAFYDLPVKLNSDRALGSIPPSRQRTIKYKSNVQIRTDHFLDDVLPKILPADAAALVAFTNSDLYSQGSTSSVFGEASADKRVGVWSLYQLGGIAPRTVSETVLLDRTLKIAMHETGHMFSMRHCIKYECLMSGTNTLAETDRRPLDNCPECMAKIAWGMNYDPVKRYAALAAFWERLGRTAEARQMTEKQAAVAKVQ